MTHLIKQSATLALAFLCLASAFGIARAQSTATYPELQKQSALLTSEQRNTARQLFETGFALWQSGEFGAAGKAFKRGLEIDPANVQANYFYGDSLQKAKQRKEASEYFKRASSLGAGTPEGFKAEAALEEIAKPVSVTEMAPEDLRELYVGNWIMEGSESYLFAISITETGTLMVSGSPKCFLCSGEYRDLVVDGKSVKFRLDDNFLYTFRLISPDRLEGTYQGTGLTAGYSGPAFAVRRQ